MIYCPSLHFLNKTCGRANKFCCPSYTFTTFKMSQNINVSWFIKPLSGLLLDRVAPELELNNVSPLLTVPSELKSVFSVSTKNSKPLDLASSATAAASAHNTNSPLVDEIELAVDIQPVSLSDSPCSC